MTLVQTGKIAEFRRRMKRQLDRQRALMAQMERINSALLESMEALSEANAVAIAKHSSLLATAVEEGDLRSLREQLASRAGPNVRNAEGEPVIIIAAVGHQVTFVRELIRAGARVDDRDESGSTALLTCARDEDIAIVRELVKGGADVNAKNIDGDTPLTNAACWGSRLVAKYLVANGADPELTDGLGVSPADLARQFGHLNIAKMLQHAAGNDK
jgi:ankyrin repeat protein